MNNSLLYLSNTYYSIYLLSNLQPNLSLYWYYFTELFPQFQLFYILLFNSLILIYLIPLYIRLKSYPILLYSILVYIIIIFQLPYIILNDLISSYLLLFGINYYLINQSLNTNNTALKEKLKFNNSNSNSSNSSTSITPYSKFYIILIILLFCLLMSNYMIYLWLIAGIGNSNFLYFQTLIIQFCNAFLLINTIANIRKFIAINSNSGKIYIKLVQEYIDLEQNNKG